MTCIVFVTTFEVQLIYNANTYIIMAHPKAYEPIEGHKYQILCRNQSYSREYEHCDYAVDLSEKKHLLENYKMAYGAGWEFKTITLPRKYWAN